MRKSKTSTNYSLKVMFFMALSVDNGQVICKLFSSFLSNSSMQNGDNNKYEKSYDEESKT